MVPPVAFGSSLIDCTFRPETDPTIACIPSWAMTSMCCTSGQIADGMSTAAVTTPMRMVSVSDKGVCVPPTHRACAPGRDPIMPVFGDTRP